MTENYKKAIEAIESGNLDRLRKLVNDNHSLTDAIDDYNNTLLHHAAGSGSLEMVDILLDAGSKVDAPGNDSGTALHWAASLNHVDICKRLIDAGASLENSDGLGEGGTPLVQALFYGHKEAAEFIARLAYTPDNLRVAAGLGRIDRLNSFFNEDGSLKPEAGSARSWYRPHDEFPERPTTDCPQEVLDEALAYACFNGRSEAASCLLQKGADPNAIVHFATALHLAVASEDRSLVRLLLEHGADPLIKDNNYGSPAAGWAEWGGNHELKSYLLEKMAETDLTAAASIGDLNKVRQHLNRIDPGAVKGDKGKSALIEALTEEHHDIAALLRAAGAKLDLLTAARMGQLEDVKALLKEGADPDMAEMIAITLPGDIQQERPQSALLAAAINRHSAICKELLAAGARLSPYSAAALNKIDELKKMLDDGHGLEKEDHFGRTVLHRAIQGHAADAVEYLLERGADINKTADFYSCGPRAIHVAAESGVDAGILDMLIAKGADVNQGSNPGHPLDCAMRFDRNETVELLRRRGAKDSEYFFKNSPQNN